MVIAMLASLSFATPWAAFGLLAVLLPAAALLSAQRRASSLRQALGLRGRQRFDRRALVLLAVVFAGIAVALAQPATGSRTAVYTRPQAAAYVVLDNSRSMLAKQKGGRTRFDRARRLALSLRESVPDVPVGLATINDNLLPALLPTLDQPLFADALAHSIGFEVPPPTSAYLGQATDFSALTSLATSRYFLPKERYRVAVVLTDGESDSFVTTLSRLVLKSHQVQLFVLQLWDKRERVYDAKGHDLGYVPSLRLAQGAKQLAVAGGTKLYREGDLGALEAAVKQALERGHRARVAVVDSRRSLARYPLIASGLALALLLVSDRRFRRPGLGPAKA